MTEHKERHSLETHPRSMLQQESLIAGRAAAHVFFATENRCWVLLCVVAPAWPSLLCLLRAGGPVTASP